MRQLDGDVGRPTTLETTPKIPGHGPTLGCAHARSLMLRGAKVRRAQARERSPSQALHRGHSVAFTRVRPEDHDGAGTGMVAPGSERFARFQAIWVSWLRASCSWLAAREVVAVVRRHLRANSSSGSPRTNRRNPSTIPRC